ncbi:TIGR02266 family protein [Thermodesulfobacteriota bacterium]
MFQIADEQTFEDGEVIFEEGSFGDWFYVIDSGSVELSRKVKGEKVVIEVLQKEAIFGELGYILKSPRAFTASAVGPTALGIIDREFLDQEYNRLSPSFKVILKTLAMRLKNESENAIYGRKSPRLPRVLSLTFKSQTSLVKAFSGNASGSGLYIRTDKPLGQGDRFSLKLTLPGDSEPLKIDCEVAWSRIDTDDEKRRPPGMGVQFVQISDADKKRLDNELKKNVVIKPS